MPPPDIAYEFSDTPASGTATEIADGVHWLRMPLPFTLDHINLWLFRDGGGWCVVDTGVCTSTTREVWKRVFIEPMNGDPATHVVVTHLHPDHAGCAGWLAERFGVDLWMTRDEYLLCRVLTADTGRPAPEAGIAFYRAAGFAEEALDRYRDMFGFFGRLVSPLPDAYRRLYDGLTGPIGDHQWEVVVGRGHSPEHACFYSRELDLFVAGDQILPTISANVGVYPTEPEANPLKDWLETLQAIRSRIPPNVLVLPAHGRPFRGAHARIDQLIAGHRERLDALLEACAAPCRAVDTFPALYRTRIDHDNLIMATGEAIAHLHYLMAEEAITAETDAAGVTWYRRV